MTLDSYYVNNDYTDVKKVHEDYVEFRTGRKHKKRRKTTKSIFPKEQA